MIKEWRIDEKTCPNTLKEFTRFNYDKDSPMYQTKEAAEFFGVHEAFLLMAGNGFNENITDCMRQFEDLFCRKI